MLPDPHIHHRGLYRDIEHPVVGVYPTATWPWKFSPNPRPARPPAPLFAEHKREILQELGYGKGRVAHLYERRVTSDEPFAPG